MSTGIELAGHLTFAKSLHRDHRRERLRIVAPSRQNVVSLRRPPLDTLDRAFLPGILEVMETPPSPIRIHLILAICGLFAAALVWSWFGWIDIHAVAQGKVQPIGRTKLIQPLETGKIRTVRVQNGDRVRAGDLLAELDPTESAADRESARHDLMAVEAEIVRRWAANEAASGPRPIAPPALVFPPGIDPATRRREETVLRADLAQLAASLSSLDPQLGEKRATRARLTASIGARQRVIVPLRERLDMRQTLLQREAGTRLAVVEALQDYERERASLVSEEGQLGETQAALGSLERKTEETVAQYLAGNTEKLSEASRRREALQESFVKANAREERTRLLALIDGTVQQLAITTPGQVVTSGQ